MAILWQRELDFERQQPTGLDSWHKEQQRQRQELARSLGLPLGKNVEIWLHGGIRLRGELRLEDATLLHVQSTLQNTRFEVNGLPFGYAEIESCVQMGASFQESQQHFCRESSPESSQTGSPDGSRLPLKRG